ncbi:hypothetical protein MTO96_043553 [Rhipicephalus appendiculatus]
MRAVVTRRGRRGNDHRGRLGLRRRRVELRADPLEIPPSRLTRRQRGAHRRVQAKGIGIRLRNHAARQAQGRVRMQANNVFVHNRS